MADEPAYFRLSPQTYLILIALLTSLSITPTLLALADMRVLPWADEWGWVRARKSVIPPEDFARAGNKFDGARVILQRGYCFGRCPRYRVTVWIDGRVEFEGLEFVCARGMQSKRIDPRLAMDLIIDMYVGGYFHKEWREEQTLTDASTVIVDMQLLKLTRRIEHYLGDMAAPRVLRDMENAIDEVAGTAQWLPRYESGEMICIDESGKRRVLPQ